MTRADVPRAPDGLKPAGRAFWNKIHSAYELSPAEAALLAQACKTLDVLAAIDRRLAAEDLVVRGSTKQPRSHPLLASRAEQARTFALLVAGLGLPMPDETEGRRRSPQQVAAAQARWRKRGEAGRGALA